MEWMDGWMEWMDGWMEWMDGWMEWMDGWMDGLERGARCKKKRCERVESALSLTLSGPRALAIEARHSQREMRSE